MTKIRKIQTPKVDFFVETVELKGPVHSWVTDLFPTTGRLVLHFEGSCLKRADCFDEGPSRRDAKNSKWRK